MRLPVVSGKKVLKALQKIGFEIDHQTGSHIIMRESQQPFRRVTVPNHKVIVPRTLVSIIRESGLTREDFIKLL